MSTTFDPFTSPMTDVGDVLVVTASAGTGKTWMITHLATRWLLEGDGGPEELLMVTFSRSSAAELRHRLRNHLRDVGSYLDRLTTSPGPVDARAEPWRVSMHRLVEERSHRAVMERHRHVVANLDAVHARTIHSFAAVATRRDESSISDDADLRREVAHEVITRRVTLADAGIASIIDDLEDQGQRRTPGGLQLAHSLERALGAAANVGGVTGGRVSVWDPRGDPKGAVVADLLAESSRRLATRLVTTGATTFDQLILDLHADVTAPTSSLAARLRDQFRFVLIDEFQDTDVMQWEIFDAVFRTSAASAPLVVVGDPKQAIYGFRGGDVTVIERVRTELATRADTVREVPLTVNHRSTAGLLDALNALFLGTDAWQFGDDTAIGYVPVTASPAHADLPGRLILRTCDTHDAARSDLVAVVRDLVSSHGAVASDVAVVSQSRHGVDECRRALERAGVRTASAGGDSIFDTPAAVQLRTLWWVLSDASNPRRVRLLAVTWFAHLRAHDVAHVANVVRERGVAAASGLLLDGLFEALAHGTRTEREVTDAEHLLDVLASRHRGPVVPERLIDTLVAGAQSGDDGGDLDASERRRVESDRDAVRVMTIHAAKGLQFPIVLIPQIESTGTTRRVATWSTPTGRAIDAASLLGRADPDSPFRDRESAGARRLMYVALTRAERLCVAWVAGTKGQWPNLVAPVLAGEAADPSLCVQKAETDLDARGDVTAIALGAVAPRPSAPPRFVGPAPTVDEHLRRWSYSALHVAGVAAAPDDAADAATEDAAGADVPARTVDVGAVDTADVFGSARGATLGSAVHRVLELLVGTTTSADGSAIADAVRASWRAHGLGVAPADAPEVIARLLARPLGPLTDGASLDDFARPGASATEVRFTLTLAPVTRGDRVARLGGLVAETDPDGPFRVFFDSLATRHDGRGELWRGYLTGSLDLVLAVGDPARYVIVDYKTNLLSAAEGYEPAALTADMARAGYPLQALLYSVALHRFLRARVRDYDPDRHLGGVGYYYVRGAARPRTVDSGLAIWRPPARAITAASDLLGGIHT